MSDSVMPKPPSLAGSQPKGQGEAPRLDFPTYLKERMEMIEGSLDHFLPGEDEPPQLLHRAMRYTVFSGGKRFRPLLTLASCEAVGGPAKRGLAVACGVELIHSYSIIHDDLPAMDNDDYRRGKPTSHRVFGEALAILAGDALLTEAFCLFTDVKLNKGMSQGTLIRIAHQAARAVGSLGMVGGQVADLNLEEAPVDLVRVESVHRQKTGALINLAVTAGALAGGAIEEELKSLSQYGDQLGLAFQISDDLLDFGEEREEEVTYPRVLGVEKALETLKRLVGKALEAIDAFDFKAEPLREMARFVQARVR